MTDQTPGEPGHITPEERARLIDEIIAIVTKYGDSLNAQHILEVLKIACATDAAILGGTSNAEGFLTFADIESLIMEENRLMHEATIKSLFQVMKRMQGESGVIDKKVIPHKVE